VLARRMAGNIDHCTVPGGPFAGGLFRTVYAQGWA